MELFNFKSLPTPYKVDQAETLSWLARAHAQAEQVLKVSDSQDEVQNGKTQAFFEKVIRRFSCSPEVIARRGTFLKDFTYTPSQESEIFNIRSEHPEGASFKERMAFYERTVMDIFSALYAETETGPKHIVHVTCTGYASPSAAQRLISNKGWGTETEVIHAYHMGCYAAFPTLQLASGLVEHMRLQKQSKTNSPIDVIHSELCSLHFNPADHRPDQIVVQSLFADGAIKYQVCQRTDDEFLPRLKVLSLKQEIVPDSVRDMTWTCSGFGMEMSLSKDVPAKIKAALPQFLKRLFRQAGLENLPAEEVPYWAIHPGGPKIIDQIQELLDLSDGQIHMSRKVLHQYGNMSSATLPHIWQDTLLDEDIADGTLIGSLAFGPGLTICGGLFQKKGETV